MLLDELCAYLETEPTSSLVLATNLFQNAMPTEPGDAVALAEYSGMGPLFRQSDAVTGPTCERPQIQLMVRGTDHDTVRDLIRTLWAWLGKVTNMDLDGTRYQSIRAMQSPFLLRRDDNKRWIFAANFHVIKEV